MFDFLAKVKRFFGRVYRNLFSQKAVLKSKKFLNVFEFISKLLLGFLLILFSIMLLPPVQSWLASVVTEQLNKTYKVDINVGRVSIGINSNVKLKEVLIRDFKKDTLFSADELATSLLNFSGLIKGELNFSSIDAKKLYFYMKTYRGDTITNLTRFVNSFSSNTPSKKPFEMNVGEVTLYKSAFKIYNYNDDDEPLNFSLEDIDMEVEKLAIKGSVVSLKVNSGSTIMDKKLKVDELKTDFAYNEKEIKAVGTSIKTPYSNLQADVEFFSNEGKYSNFLYDVQSRIYIFNSEIGTEDLNVFYNGFGVGDKVNLFGLFEGSIDDLRTNDTHFSFRNTSVVGNFLFKEIFDKEKKFKIDAMLEDIFVSYNELVSFMPKLLGEKLPKQIKKLGFINGSGILSYDQENLSCDLKLSTEMGKADVACILEDLSHPAQTQYSGMIKAKNLAIGNILDVKSLGNLTGNIELDGKGFEVKNLERIHVNGDIGSIGLLGYDYQNVKIKGELKGRTFDGDVTFDDPNIKMDVKGTAGVDAKGESMYDFVADVRDADLRAIKITKDSISNFNTKVEIQARGNDVEKVEGNLSVKGIRFDKVDRGFKFGELNAVVNIDERNVKTIKIISEDIVKGDVKGFFSFGDIGKMVKNSLGSLYTNYKPVEIKKDQYVEFDFEVKSKAIEAFSSSIEVGNSTKVSGEINKREEENVFRLNFSSPFVGLGGVNFSDLLLEVDNKNKDYNTQFKIKKIDLGAYSFSDFRLENSTKNDTLFLKGVAKGRGKDDFILNIYHTVNKKQEWVFGLKDSQIHYKGKEWAVNNEKKNRIMISNDFKNIDLETIQLVNGEQTISFDGDVSEDRNKRGYHLVFNKVELKDLMPEIKNIEASGEINGHFSIIKDGDLTVPYSSMRIDKLSLNKMEMGDLSFDIDSNDKLSLFNIDCNLNKDGAVSFSTTGDIKAEDRQTLLNINVGFYSFDISPFSSLLGGVLSDLRGKMDGYVKMRGSTKKPKMEGDLNVMRMGVGIPFLKVNTEFDERVSIDVRDNGFFFKEIGITDTVKRTKAYMDGKITHKNFKDWYLDLKVDTRGGDFLVLNTMEKDNDMFYGTVFLKGNARLWGAFDGLTILVNGKSGKGGKLNIPLRDIRTVGDDSFIKFVSKNKSEKEKKKKIYFNNRGLEIRLDLDIEPTSEVSVIIDPKTNSGLSVKGAGTVLLEINTNGKFNMLGDFTTQSGIYNFKYESLIDKKFKVLPGGSIVWNGDPFNAELSNMKAVYSLSSDPSVLTSKTSKNRKLKTEVELSLEGILSSPKTVFDIKFPDASPTLKSEVEYVLRDNDKKQLQALSLLVQGNFVNENTVGNKILSHNALETASGMFNDIMNEDGSNLNLGLSYEAAQITPTSEINTSDRLGVTFSADVTDRIILNGKIGIPLGGKTQTAIAINGDLQFLLNESGSLSLKVFHRENDLEDYLYDRINYTRGVGISYKREFNTVKQLLEGIFERQRKKKNGTKKE